MLVSGELICAVVVLRCPHCLTIQVTHGFEAYHLGQEFPSAIRGFGRVKWRRDGFVSLSSAFDGSTGVLLTAPIVVEPVAPGNELRILLNVETSVSGGVGVDLMLGTVVLPGYRSLPVMGNSVSAPVIFNATLAGMTNFSCNVENNPHQMPAPGSVILQTDVSPAFSQAGSAGVTMNITVRDARIYSITLAEVSV